MNNYCDTSFLPSTFNYDIAALQKAVQQIIHRGESIEPLITALLYSGADDGFKDQSHSLQRLHECISSKR